MRTIVSVAGACGQGRKKRNSGRRHCTGVGPVATMVQAEAEHSPAHVTMKFHVDHTSPPLSPGRRTIFVFGSNTAGRHGMGAALYAAKHMGAERFVGHGRTGDAYAIPTKGGGRTGPLWTLPLAEIAPQVKSFVTYAATHPELDFLVTRIGCGLAGYADTQIAPMFSGATPNCSFVVDWRAFLQESSEGGQPADWVEAGLRLT